MVKVAWCAGHGLYTAGKRTPAGEREWTFNNKVIRAAMDYLEQYQGVDQIRVDDPTGRVDVALSIRVKRANDFKADAYISAHHNAFKGVWGTHTGTETYVMDPASGNPRSMALARAVHPGLVKAMGLSDRGIKAANFYVLRETGFKGHPMAAILTEGGYMDSSIDVKRLRNDAVLKAAGEAMAKGVVNHYGLKRKPKPSVNINPKYTTNPADRIGTVVIGSQAMNYRTEPSLNAPIIRVLPAGHGSGKKTVHLYEEKGDWIRLGAGWISNADGKYAKVKKYPPKPKKDIYRVIIDGVQVGAFSEDDNAIEEAREAIEARKKNIKIEKV
ncbi:N-acetylmuramoyl-L-alanine amidase [Jeotgalibacillus haloalkalitolerans]|uniref:N-acetylmuramoyl-L-alanine amidase n=1 Tax=Jeotgalibacillus haloalkalitolerans TaxID=3104292 RepID=A0ABU5KNG7_9BACL|nr:N-acetylmuramoyl-L-alanine amidase [Jeotgalibacillus sp. HH7-29]MDZ5712230.1 N-acetylmuramoyl-L-alanine amidase [Jeotgalibacillus sp. HH7-29]